MAGAVTPLHSLNMGLAYLLVSISCPRSNNGCLTLSRFGKGGKATLILFKGFDYLAARFGLEMCVIRFAGHSTEFHPLLPNGVQPNVPIETNSPEVFA
jgi:hypothetical protein